MGLQLYVDGVLFLRMPLGNYFSRGFPSVGAGLEISLELAPTQASFDCHTLKEIMVTGILYLLAFLGNDLRAANAAL
jgi:hypothetical protein